MVSRKLKVLMLASCVAFYVLSLYSVAEAKVLPQAKKIGQPSAKSYSQSNIGVYPKLRSDRRAVLINFANLQNASQVAYMLIYDSDTQKEGAMGGLNLTGQSSQSSEILFGTCSKNVCRYHTGIKNAKLDISYTLTNGKKYLKKYKIKV